MKCTAKNPWKCTVRVCTCGFFAAPAQRRVEFGPRFARARGLRVAEDAHRRRMETAFLARLWALSLPPERGR